MSIYEGNLQRTKDVKKMFFYSWVNIRGKQICKGKLKIIIALCCAQNREEWERIQDYKKRISLI